MIVADCSGLVEYQTIGHWLSLSWIRGKPMGTAERGSPINGSIEISVLLENVAVYKGLLR